jgi:hypothetical protein
LFGRQAHQLLNMAASILRAIFRLATAFRLIDGLADAGAKDGE